MARKNALGHDPLENLRKLMLSGGQSEAPEDEAGSPGERPSDGEDTESRQDDLGSLGEHPSGQNDAGGPTPEVPDGPGDNLSPGSSTDEKDPGVASGSEEHKEDSPPSGDSAGEAPALPPSPSRAVSAVPAGGRGVVVRLARSVGKSSPVGATVKEGVAGFPVIRPAPKASRLTLEERSLAMQRLYADPVFPKWLSETELEVWRQRSSLWLLKTIGGEEPAVASNVWGSWNDINCSKGGSVIKLKEANYVATEFFRLIVPPRGFRDISEVREWLLERILPIVEQEIDKELDK